MAEFITILFGVSAYIAIAVLFSHVQAKLIDEPDREDGAVVIPSTFWPVSLVVWVLIGLVTGIAKVVNKSIERVNQPRLPKLANESEIIPGVERPSLILAQMVAARFIQNFNNLEGRRYNDSKVVVRWEYPYGQAFLPKEARDFVIEVGGKRLGVAENDKQATKLLRDALIKGFDLKEQKKQKDAEAAKEHEALSIIESMTLSPSVSE